MTFIFSLITEEAVYQISDRRLTNPTNPTIQVDNDANKAVVACGRMAFGYTGTSMVGSEKVDDWLARVIGSGPCGFDADLGVVAQRIRDEASKDFRRIPCPPKYKRQAFQGVGWVTLDDGAPYIPSIITIENAIDHRSGKWLPLPRGWFKSSPYLPELRDGYFCTAVGQNIHESEKQAIVKKIYGCIKNPKSTMEAIGIALIDIMIWLSGRYQTIGNVGQLVCIPKSAVEHPLPKRRSMIINGLPGPDVSTFFYYSEAGGGVQHGPHYVCGVSLTNISATYSSATE